MSDDLHYLTLSEVAGQLREQTISPVDLVEHMLARIEAIDPSALSFATVMADEARTEAAEAAAEIAAGRYRGPLHGVPVAVKDLCYTRGVRTMGGCKVLADFVPDFDSTVVRRLRDAGAVLLGKLNLTEGAMGGYNPEFAIPQNPWSNDHWAGSSSSGSGVATALGLCFGSLGSDTGGSIRFPSAANGIVGLKPTWGRVSRHGVLALAESLDHVGPMTRSVADAAIMLEAIAGEDPDDPTSLPDPVANMLEGLSSGVKGLRIGFDPEYAGDGVDAELFAAVRDAVAVFADRGAAMINVRMPDVDRYLPAWPTLCTAEAVHAHRRNYPSRRDDYGPWFRDWLDAGAKTTGADYAAANDQRAECNALIAKALADVDVLVCPSMMGPPYAVTKEANYGPRDNRRGTSFQRFTAPYDFNGWPTLSLPCGFNGAGLPLSVQLVGKPLSEALLCRVGEAFEAATTWHERHPPEPAAG